ncbi:MAG: DUF2726 domain-containing protein [Nitrospiraceae bacterium]
MDMSYLAVGGGVALSLMMLGWYVSVRKSFAKRSASLLPSDTQVLLKPVLSDAEAKIYNLLRLAVQDRYLIFAQVPLWCLLDIRSSESELRLPLLSQLALKRATFVLLHAGTRRAEKVVELHEDSDTGLRRERNDRLLETVLASAGVQLVRVNAGMAYTVPMLTALLDVAESD